MSSATPSPNGGNLMHPDNPVVFLDVSIGGQALGRIKIELLHT